MTAVGILPTEMGFSVMRMSAMIPSPGETGSVGEDADEEVKAIVDDGDTEAGTRIRSSYVEKHIEKKKTEKQRTKFSPLERRSNQRRRMQSSRSEIECTVITIRDPGP